MIWVRDNRNRYSLTPLRGTRRAVIEYISTVGPSPLIWLWTNGTGNPHRPAFSGYLFEAKAICEEWVRNGTVPALPERTGV